MDVGLQLIFSSHGYEASSDGQVIDEELRLARLTHDLGFDVVIGGSLYADAMGSEGTPDGTYVGMVRANVRTIVGALGGDAG